MPTHTLLRDKTRKIGLWFQVAVLASAGVMPLIFGSAASAVPQLTNRFASVTTARPGQTFDITIQFRIPSGSNAIQGIQIEFCDAPLATCATTNTPTIPNSSTVSQNGNWTNSTAWAGYTRQSGANGGTNNQIQVTRTETNTETQSGSSDRSITFTGLTHNATANKSFYPRIRLYNDNTTLNGTTIIYEGAVAQSTSQTLTVNARVQEILQFCVGSTTVDDADTTQIVTDCSAASGTSVDLGVVTSTVVSKTPVPTGTGANGTGGDAKNGYAMVQTNAQNGVAIAYKAVQDTSSGKLKVPSSACDATFPNTSVTDQCFNSAGTTQATFTAGTEKFGMTIGGINCESVPGTAYTCTFSSGLTNLQPLTNYIGGAYTNGASGTYGNTAGFAWDDTGAATTIASSASSAVKVVANEALVLKFGATASITTPTGQYQAQADFIATPTF